MEFVPFSILLCPFLCTCFYVLTSILRPQRRPNLPPGPPPIPIIGNLLQLGRNSHQTLTKLSKIYGPLMHLKLGTIDTIVASSPELAKQVLQKHDQVLSARFHYAVTDTNSHNKVSIAWLPAASRWRVLRKICKEQMFSQLRLDETQGLRKEKLKKLRDYVQECCDSSRVLDIADAAFITLLNHISATLFSMDFGQFNSDSSQEFKKIVCGSMQVAATPNLADYFPFLKPIDPQGLKRRAAVYFRKVSKIFDDIIDRRLMDSESKNDLLDALLDMSRKNESELTRKDMTHLLVDLFLAGIDTSATTVEWAMAELIRNPEKMAKARDELRTVVGENGEIEESDISKLPYLQGVIKETFRLHPGAPLLIPHKAEADTAINGYTVPKNAQILVNIWAIGRDSSVWSNPDSFEPERFLATKIDIRGQDFELIPFGSGRRMCPGLPLAYRMVHLVVATLIHNFDWKLEHGIKPQELNMNEKFEFSLKRAVPLMAAPVEL